MRVVCVCRLQSCGHCAFPPGSWTLRAFVLGYGIHLRLSSRPGGGEGSFFLCEHPVAPEPRMEETAPPWIPCTCVIVTAPYGGDQFPGSAFCPMAHRFLPPLISAALSLEVGYLPRLAKFMVLVVCRSFWIHGAHKSCLQIKTVYILKSSLSPFSLFLLETSAGRTTAPCSPGARTRAFPFCRRRGAGVWRLGTDAPR